MNLIEEIAGELCKVLFPIEDRLYYGNSSSPIAVCTLSSMRLLEELARSPLMSKINTAGRLLSENRGIDALARNVISNGKIVTMILCGKDPIGHRPGHSLLCLHKNGIDGQGRIVGSHSTDPVLSLTKDEVAQFQKQTRIIDMIGQTSFSDLKLEITSEIQ